MNIIEAMQSDNLNLRISYGWRWMVWDKDAWVIYEYRRYYKKAKVVGMTNDESAAVKMLTAD